MTVQELLNRFLGGFLWADEDWLRFSSDPSDAAAFYWQSRLAMRISVRSLDDGWVKWQVLVRIVEGVTDDQAALETCLALNRLAAGWSYAYEETAKVVMALASVRCPAGDTPDVLRLSEAAKLAGWQSEVLAEWVAERVGGQAAWCGPDGTDHLREEPDGTFHYARVLRSRPEWVYNLLPTAFPPLEEVVEAFEAGLPEAFRQDVTVNDEAIQLLGVHGEEARHAWFALVARWDRHPVFGLGWSTTMMLPTMAANDAARLANTLAWETFYRDDCSLLGAWTVTPLGMAFRVWATASEVRNYERIDDFPGHTPGLLWHISSTGGDAIWLATAGQTPPVAHQQHVDVADQDNLVNEALTKIRELAGDLEDVPTPPDERPVGRGPLWLTPVATLVTMAWFNPAGPTCSTLQVSRFADDRQYLVYLMRHPFLPEYRILAPVRTDQDVITALPEALDVMLAGSPPTAVTIEECPEHLEEAVSSHLKERLLANDLAAQPDFFAGAASRLEATLGRPWDHASLDSGVGQDSPYAQLPRAEQYDAWWAIASDPMNVFSVFRDLPWAWDGALNYQMSAGGGLGLFDTEPLITVYSNIGRMDGQDVSGQDKSAQEDSERDDLLARRSSAEALGDA